MTLFDTQGHLTDEAILAVIQETLDDLSRLEVAEHLSFCDNCLVRYTAMLTEDSLLTPQQPIVPPLLVRLRRQAVRVVFNKYTTYAAAAGFSLVLWGAGVFTGVLPKVAAAMQPPEPLQRPAYTQRGENFFDSISEALNSVLQWEDGGFFRSLRNDRNADQTKPTSDSTTQK